MFLAGASSAKSQAGKTTTTHAASKQTSKKSGHHRRRSRKSSWKRHGQQNIDTTRVREIQQALIREKYMNGEPSGKWDAPTQAAMARYQTDNGWQSKVTPDSRALIKLGLGPNHSSEGLINSADASGANPTGGNNAPNRQ